VGYWGGTGGSGEYYFQAEVVFGWRCLGEKNSDLERGPGESGRDGQAYWAEGRGAMMNFKAKNKKKGLRQHSN